MEIYDVTNAIIDEDKVICALFDGRYDSLVLIEVKPKGNSGLWQLKLREPDDEERLYWVDKFGLLSEEEIQAEYERLLLSPSMARAIYERMKAYYE